MNRNEGKYLVMTDVANEMHMKSRLLIIVSIFMVMLIASYVVRVNHYCPELNWQLHLHYAED